MKKAHKISFSSTFVLLLGVLTACNGNSESADGEEVDFPDDTVTIITAFAAGGSNDSLARMLAEHTENNNEDFDFVIENIEGGSGAVGQATGAEADPDGHTLTLVTTSIVSNPMFNNVPYTHESFEPVILLNNEPLVMLASDEAPFDDYDSFVEYAENNPGEVSVGASGAETTNAFASRDLAETLDIDTTTVPHDGTADAVLQAEGGHIETVIASYGEVESQIENGDLHPILVFGEEPLEYIPEVTTAAEEGVDVFYAPWRGVAAPAGTDPEIIDYLHEVFSETIETSEYQESMDTLNLGINYMGPEDFQQLIDETYENYSEYGNE